MIPHPLAAHVKGIIREHALFSPGDTVVVALSGGADSRALLDILAGIKEMGIRLVIAHLNHCLRGAESDGDEQFCRELAEQYALPFESRRVDVAALASRERLSLEDAGRRARIAFLDEIRATYRASAIALAHHADDQAETVLMRLLRGSSASGLSGMAFKSANGRIRPLLTSARHEIEEYLHNWGLTYREDASNRDTTFLRNRIRHELLPLLAGYNPAIRERLVATAAILADEDDLLKHQTRQLAATACHISAHGITITLNSLKNEHPALQRRLFLHALTELAGDGDHFSRKHILALERLADSANPSATINLPRGIRALREYGLLRLVNTPLPLQVEDCQRDIPGPGRYRLFNGDLLTISAADVPPSPATLPPDVALFDLDKAPFPWSARTFRDGDRFEPIGMTGGRKLKDYFIDRKIPRPERRTIPLLCHGDRLLWICGMRASRVAALDRSSKKIIMAVYSQG